MNCQNCGAEIVANSQFCTRCGTRVAVPTPPAMPGGMNPAARPGGGINIDTDGQGAGFGYSFEVLHQPSFSLAVIHLEPERSICAEAGAMVSMSANVDAIVCGDSVVSKPATRL